MRLDKNGEEQHKVEQDSFVQQASEQANLGLKYDLSHPIVRRPHEAEPETERRNPVDQAKVLSEAREITLSPEQYIQTIHDVVRNSDNPRKDHLYEMHFTHLSNLLTMSKRFNNKVPGTDQRIFHPEVLEKWKTKFARTQSTNNSEVESGHLEALEKPIR